MIQPEDIVRSGPNQFISQKESIMNLNPLFLLFSHLL